ncbi:MAG TPA: sigma-70 family RNA polymerase sigma factor [Solirubrobacterales bacterium]|nr:sigma-70 family RNA polymerase sigma factor [Solirubrobacterales bacterium]
MQAAPAAAADEVLIARAREGDVRAYEELVERHQRTAFRVAWLITRSTPEAEEAAQDAFVKAHAALGRFRAGAPFRPWLLKIVTNEARNRRVAASRRERLGLRAVEAAEESAPAAEAEAIAGSDRAALLAAIGRLDRRDQLVIGARFLLELSEAETAAALGVRRGTVKSRTSRALARLRKEVEADA